MGNCDTCGVKDSCNSKTKFLLKTNSNPWNIKNIIGVISGKGGVGKSTITGLTALELTKQGYKIGVLDADITGPSMPRFWPAGGKSYWHPEITLTKLYSSLLQAKRHKNYALNFLTEVEDQPVIWREPVITGVLNQMFSDTNWGELDYLLIDMLPEPAT